MAAPFPCPGQKVSLFETWEYDLVAYIPGLILLELGATYLSSQIRYITDYQRRYFLNIFLPWLPGDDRQFAHHNRLSLCFQPR